MRSTSSMLCGGASLPRWSTGPLCSAARFAAGQTGNRGNRTAREQRQQNSEIDVPCVCLGVHSVLTGHRLTWVCRKLFCRTGRAESAAHVHTGKAGRPQNMTWMSAARSRLANTCSRGLPWPKACRALRLCRQGAKGWNSWSTRMHHAGGLQGQNTLVVDTADAGGAGNSVPQRQSQQTFECGCMHHSSQVVCSRIVHLQPEHVAREGVSDWTPA